MSERFPRQISPFTIRLLPWLIVCGLLPLSHQPASAAPPHYKLFDLGDLLGGLGNSFGSAINASGQVTGYSDFRYPDTHVDASAFRSSGTAPAISLTNLGDLGGERSQGFGINSAGQVVGESDNADFETHAFRTSGSTLRDLGTLGGTNSTAHGINTIGETAGTSDNASGFGHAFRSSPNSAGSITLTDLGTLGGSFSQGMGINTSGQVAGFSSTAGGATLAFRSSATGAGSITLTSLGTLGGGSSFGQGINDSGQVVGFSDIGSGISHAFRSSATVAVSMTLTDLGTLGGNSQGFGINNLGQVVGTSNGHAFFYSDAAGILDLNSLLSNPSGWTLEQANGINDAGFITGFGLLPGGLTEHAFLLAPEDSTTPEPGTFAFALSGCLVLTGLTQLRKYQKASRKQRFSLLAS